MNLIKEITDWPSVANPLFLYYLCLSSAGRTRGVGTFLTLSSGVLPGDTEGKACFNIYLGFSSRLIPREKLVLAFTSVFQAV